MRWLNQNNGGPWGGGPWGGSPWGNGNRGGNGQGPRNRGPQPPNIDDLIRKSQEQLRRLMPGGFGTGPAIAVVGAAILVIWGLTGFYRVQPDEVGVVLRFGAYNRTTTSGLNWHFPAPIESVQKPQVTRINRTEIGFRTTADGTPAARSPGGRQLAEEALMLTGDENIVDINFSVLWVIKDAKLYLFSIRNPDATVKAAAESAMREVIGRTPIASILSEGRLAAEQGTQKLLQGMLDAYGAGIEVTQVNLQKVDPPAQVIDSFRDVQSARADQERLRNEAEAYRNAVLPAARGESVRLVQEAEAYKQEIVARAQGDAERFLSVYRAYQAAPDVTMRRIYLETMEEVLKGASKIIIDKSAQGASGVVPYLPLGEVGRRAAPARGGGSASPSSPATPVGAAPATGQPAAPGAAPRVTRP